MPVYGLLPPLIALPSTRPRPQTDSELTPDIVENAATIPLLGVFLPERLGYDRSHGTGLEVDLSAEIVAPVD